MYKKIKTKLLTIILFCITICVNAQYSYEYQATTVITPTGVSVDALQFMYWIYNDFTPSEQASEDYQWTNNYNCEIINSSTKYYNCHGYAWHNIEGNMDQDKLRWINNVDYNGNPTYNVNKYYSSIYSDGKPSYRETTINNKANLKVSYFPRDHSAITTSDPQKLISKWAWGPLVKHTVSQCPFYANAQIKYYEIAYSISGPSTICDQATYTIGNLPAGATVQWSVSPAGIVSLQTNGNEAVLTRINAGTINLTSTILLGAQSITISKENMKVSDSSPGIAFLSSNNLRATNAPNEFEVLRDPIDNYLYKGSLSVRITNAASIAWVEISGTMDWSSFLNTVTVSSKKQGSLTLECRASNACGTETLRYHFGVGILIDVAVYPNPATDMVTVEFKIDSAVNPAIQDLNESVSSGVYEIQLWDSASMLRSYKTHETSFQIPLTGLPKGIYFVRVIKDGETYTQKLIKN